MSLNARLTLLRRNLDLLFTPVFVVSEVSEPGKSVPVWSLANVVVVANQDLLSPLDVADGSHAHDQTKPGVPQLHETGIRSEGVTD